MDITNYVKATGEFLKAEDVKKDSKFTITDEPEIVTNEKFGTERLHIQGEIDGVKKTFDCSRTNARAISTELGNDTSKWIGKTLELETYKTKTSEGKLVDAINVKNIIV